MKNRVIQDVLKRVVSKYYRIDNYRKIKKISRFAQDHLSKNRSEKKVKVLFFPSFENCEYVRMIDATLLLALKLRNVEVIPVISGFFYKEQDVIFGGLYNKDREDKVTEYHLNQINLYGKFLKSPSISLEAFVQKSSEDEASHFSNRITFDNYRELFHDGIAVGVMAETAVCNLNNISRITADESHLRELRWHAYNIIRLIEATKNILDAVRPDCVLSNAPFYYQWRVPFLVAKTKTVSFFSFQISERKNALFWGLNEEKMLSCDGAWKSFLASGISERFGYLIDDGIKDRKNGDSFGVNFLKLGKGRSHTIL
jgi:hypothetical protein